MRQGCALLISGSKGKGQGHSALISGNGFLRITAFPLHPWSQNFTGTLLLNQGCALLISGSKGQRSRSQCINYWKLFPAHNYFLFKPIIMKLHVQTTHESRMCLEKLSPRGVFVPLGQPQSSSICISFSALFFIWTMLKISKLHIPQ